MLTITVSDREYYDEEKEEFVSPVGAKLEMEHSLVSLSKWESIWEKPFLSKDSKTTEETLSYVKCMILTPDLPPEVFAGLTNEHLNAVNTYIHAKMTATWFNDKKGGKPSQEIITSELIYY